MTVGELIIEVFPIIAGFLIGTIGTLAFIDFVERRFNISPTIISCATLIIVLALLWNMEI